MANFINKASIENANSKCKIRMRSRLWAERLQYIPHKTNRVARVCCGVRRLPENATSTYYRTMKNDAQKRARISIIFFISTAFFNSRTVVAVVFGMRMHSVAEDFHGRQCEFGMIRRRPHISIITYLFYCFSRVFWQSFGGRFYIHFCGAAVSNGRTQKNLNTFHSLWLKIRNDDVAVHALA